MYAAINKLSAMCVLLGRRVFSFLFSLAILFGGISALFWLVSDVSACFLIQYLRHSELSILSVLRTVLKMLLSVHLTSNPHPPFQMTGSLSHLSST